jgi:hypothetical protein
MTNDTTQAIDLDTMVDESTVPSRSPRPNRRTRRLAAGAAAVVVALGVGGVLALSGGSDDRTAAGPATSAAPLAAVAAPPAAGSAADPAPAPSDPPVGDSGQSGEETPDPVPPAAPGHLVVSTTNVVLATNDFDGGFELTNDGGSDVEWQWMAGHPSIAAAPSGGVLAPGESIVVEFTISWQQLANGGFVYQNHVVSDDQSVKVTVSGTRDIEVNDDIELPDPELTLDED